MYGVLESDDSILSGPHLVAMGSFMSADPTRIVAKRIILTGHPFKVHRKTATVRYMFFNRGELRKLICTNRSMLIPSYFSLTDDIEYFAPIELHTKYGRTGHIKGEWARFVKYESRLTLKRPLLLPQSLSERMVTSRPFSISRFSRWTRFGESGDSRGGPILELAC